MRKKAVGLNGPTRASVTDVQVMILDNRDDPDERETQRRIRECLRNRTRRKELLINISYLPDIHTGWVKNSHNSESTLLRRMRSRVYWGLISVIHQLAGTRLYERKWASRSKTLDSVCFDVDHPHRKWLMEQFDKLCPFSSVLEVGCGYGPNVQILALRFPSAQVLDLDINPVSVREGNIRLAELGLNRAHLVVGKADDLSDFADSSIDVVFTDAALLYIGPDKIRRVIAEMSRVSRKALLLLELHRLDLWWDRKGLGVHTPDGWVRDYRKLLKQSFDEDSITLTKVPAGVWPTGRWPVYGYLITVIR